VPATDKGERDARIAALTRSVRDWLAKRLAAAPFLADFPQIAVTRLTAPRRLPVCDWLAGAETLSAPATAELVSAFVAAAPTLDWRQTYSVEDFGARFLQRYGWTEVVGSRGPIASAKIACGFLLLGPDIEYPAHAHEAHEIYFPLAGEAFWMRDRGEFAAHAPGAIIEHQPWTPHATRTRDDPMLALYIWRGGDLAAKSTVLGRDD
jgi:uncharacterized RmlC-like cupin family protein